MESRTSSLLAVGVQMGKAQPPRLACLRSPRCALMHIFTAFEAARWLDTGHWTPKGSCPPVVVCSNRQQQTKSHLATGLKEGRAALVITQNDGRLTSSVRTFNADRRGSRGQAEQSGPAYTLRSSKHFIVIPRCQVSAICRCNGDTQLHRFSTTPSGLDLRETDACQSRDNTYSGVQAWR